MTCLQIKKSNDPDDEYMNCGGNRNEIYDCIGFNVLHKWPHIRRSISISMHLREEVVSSSAETVAAEEAVAALEE